MAAEPSGESLAGKGARAVTPWRKGIAWWVALIEGLVAFGVGLYMVIAPSSTADMMFKVLACLLAVVGLLELIAALRMKREGRVRQATLLQGAIGLVVGGLLIILMFTDSLTMDAGRIILGLGGVAFGLIGVYRFFAARSGQEVRGGILMAFFLLVVGILVLLAAFGVVDSATTVRIIAVLLLICGALLIGWAFWLRRGARKALPAGASPAGRT